MMMMMMMLVLLTENNTAKEKKKKRRKRSSYFLTNTHTHTLSLSLSLSLSLCVCVCRFLSENSLPRVTAVSALLYIISDEKHKRKIFSKKREKERKERNAHLLGLKTLNKKNRQKSLSGRKCIDAQQEETD